MSSDAHDECRDIEDIKRLKSRYFRYLDAKDSNGFRGLFTDDATFEGVRGITRMDPTSSWRARLLGWPQ